MKSVKPKDGASDEQNGGSGAVGRRRSECGGRFRWRETQHASYRVSLRIRKKIEEAFDWIKTIARQDKTFRGYDRVGWAFTFAAAAYDLVRLPKLMTASP